MKHTLILFLSISFFLSCSKKSDPVIPNTTLPAENLQNVSYGSDPAQKMDIYLPAGRSTDSTKLIIMVHGGAWSTGDKADFNLYVPVIQQRLKGYAIANINYRLATTAANHFPTQENDMKAAFDFLVQKSAEYHLSDKIVLLGASSGGHQVTLQAYKNASPKIKAVVDFFAPVDMAALYNSATPGSVNQLAIQILVGGTPSSNPAAYQQSSPINFVSAQSPPTIILHGDQDNIVPISQSVALKNKLSSLGVTVEMVTYPNLGHDVWPDATMTDAFQKIETFVKTNVH